MIPGQPCTRRIGFLFPRPCGRLTSVGCPDCANGQIDDPYSRSYRGGYSEGEFDDYGADEIGGLSSAPVQFGGGDAGGAGASDDFTEADGESLVKADDNFEDDLSAS